MIDGYGADVDLEVIQAWWSLRSLRGVPWLMEHGFDPDAPGREIEILNRQATPTDPGQADAAADMPRLLAGSPIVASHRGPECTRMQDANSLRCALSVLSRIRSIPSRRYGVAPTVDTSLYSSASRNRGVQCPDCLVVSS